MKRREFLQGTAAALALPLVADAATNPAAPRATDIYDVFAAAESRFLTEPRFRAAIVSCMNRVTRQEIHKGDYFASHYGFVTVQCLCLYGNAFFGCDTKPGDNTAKHLFTLAPRDVQIYIDDMSNGELYYGVEIGDDHKVFSEDELLHLAWNDRYHHMPNVGWGYPPILQYGSIEHDENWRAFAADLDKGRYDSQLRHRVHRFKRHLLEKAPCLLTI